MSVAMRSGLDVAAGSSSAQPMMPNDAAAHTAINDTRLYSPLSTTKHYS